MSTEDISQLEAELKKLSVTEAPAAADKTDGAAADAKADAKAAETAAAVDSTIAPEDHSIAVPFDRSMPSFAPFVEDPAFLALEYHSPIALVNNNFLQVRARARKEIATSRKYILI